MNGCHTRQTNDCAKHLSRSGRLSRIAEAVDEVRYTGDVRQERHDPQRRHALAHLVDLEGMSEAVAMTWPRASGRGSTEPAATVTVRSGLPYTT